MPEMSQTGEVTLRGIPVSAGVCKGRVIVLDRAKPVVQERRLAPEELHTEVDRLEKALVQTRHQLIDIQHRVSEAMGADEASIFDAHLLVLEDRTLLDEVVRLVQERRVNAEHAFHEVAERYANSLARTQDDYLRERASDMRDVTNRVLNNLLGRQEDFDLRSIREPTIVLSHDLTPSNTAQLDKRYVLGFGTDVGATTSHTAIMARSLRIPAVVGLRDATNHVRPGQFALLDGINGLLILNPTDQTLYDYGQIESKQLSTQEKLRELLPQPATTLDGFRVLLCANIEQAEDAEQVLANGADGVGLFRTEYLFLDRGVPPTEEQQYSAYRSAALALLGKPLIIRTLDVGGDKLMAHLPTPAEMNPFLGWRAIRFCLQQRDIFREQLRAILRASAEGNIKMMYPMISGLEELEQATDLLEEYKAELRQEEIPFDENMEVGAMIETPSAAIVSDSLARRLKFFSIGTNDLIQYSLAVDRMNEKIAHLYEPTHPAIVRLIKIAVDAAHRHNIPVGVCGEMASDPVLVPLLLGLGVDQLSAACGLVPQVKYVIRGLRMTDARELANYALECESAKDILDKCQNVARQAAPGIFETK